MALIAVTAGKGSPGVTTTAVVLAAVWPREAVLADCDPAGGDVALRLPAVDGQPLRRDRGLVALAARLRTATPARAGWAEHVQLAAGGLPVLTGLSGPAQAAALGPLWPALAGALRAGAGPGTDIIADCGRHHPGGPADAVLAAADVVLVVVRPTVEALTHLRGTLSALPPGSSPSRSRPVLVVVVDDPRAPATGEVAAAVQSTREGEREGARVVGSLAFDPAGAAGLAGTPNRRLDRTRLVVSARRLATGVDPFVPVATPPPPVPPLPAAIGDGRPVQLAPAAAGAAGVSS